MPQFEIDIPQGEPAEQLDRVLQIRLTSAQHEEIQQLAKSLGLHKSTMARNLLLQIVRQISKSSEIQEQAHEPDEKP